MHVVIVNQFFWPDIAPTGQYASDLARYLVAQGHEVTVVCGGGAYAQASGGGEEPPPVRILRIPGFTYRRGVLGRFLSYSTFFLGALWHELTVPRPDIILSMTTPPLLSVAGCITKALRGIRHFIWEMDVFPDVLVSLGALSERGVISRALGWIQNYTRRHSDGIIALGPCMRTRLLAHGISPDLVHVAENWVDGSLISPLPIRQSGPLNVFYSGNLGLLHDIDTIWAAMRHFRNDPRFLFTFAGGGVGKTQLQQSCEAEKIENARFLPYVDRQEMNDHLGQADLGLVTERPACSGTVVPSKTYGLMAAGRPILFIGPRDATPALVTQRFQCGWQIDPGDTVNLIQLLDSLANRREPLHESGQRARAAFELNYDLKLGVARVAAALGFDSDNSPTPLRKTVPATI